MKNNNGASFVGKCLRHIDSPEQLELPKIDIEEDVTFHNGEENENLEDTSYQKYWIKIFMTYWKPSIKIVLHQD